MSIFASIHGRAARDGELRESASGTTWCRINAACRAGVSRENNEPLTQWVTVLAFGRQAEALAKVARGESLSAIGRVELSKWDAKDGTARETLQLIAESVVTVRSARPPGRRPDNGDRKQSPADVLFNDQIPPW